MNVSLQHCQACAGFNDVQQPHLLLSCCRHFEHGGWRSGCWHDRYASTVDLRAVSHLSPIVSAACKPRCVILTSAQLQPAAHLTRSYIFSQTIFSMRAGVDNRLHGWIIAVTELSLFFLPISIIQYLVILCILPIALGVFAIEMCATEHLQCMLLAAAHVLLWSTPGESWP
jgi:hypothetical protein